MMMDQGCFSGAGWARWGGRAAWLTLVLLSCGFGRLALAEEPAKTDDAADPSAEPSAAAEPAKAEAAHTKKDDLGVKGLKTSNGQGYGPAGCGLGSLLFSPDSGFTQVLAATTNGLFGSQTFGISSGTSNCADTGGGTASARAFVETNRAALAKDIARGQGEAIESLAKLAHCAAGAPVAASLQRNFAKIFPTASASDVQVSHSVVDVLKADPVLACSALG
jgi:hypothetical protein